MKPYKSKDRKFWFVFDPEGRCVAIRDYKWDAVRDAQRVWCGGTLYGTTQYEDQWFRKRAKEGWTIERRVVTKDEKART